MAAGRYRPCDKTGRERIKGLYRRAGTRKSSKRARTFDAAGTLSLFPLPFSLPRPSRRAATRRYGIFAERLFLIDAIQTSRRQRAWRARKTFRRLSRTFAAREFEVPAFFLFRHQSFVLITEKHSPRALLGRIKLPRNCSPSSGIMPSSLSE